LQQRLGRLEVKVAHGKKGKTQLTRNHDPAITLGHFPKMAANPFPIAKVEAVIDRHFAPGK